MVGPRGFEPRTSRLSAGRSNQAELRAPYRLEEMYFIRFNAPGNELAAVGCHALRSSILKYRKYIT